MKVIPINFEVEDEVMVRRRLDDKFHPAYLHRQLSEEYWNTKWGDTGEIIQKHIKDIYPSYIESYGW